MVYTLTYQSCVLIILTKAEFLESFFDIVINVTHFNLMRLKRKSAVVALPVPLIVEKNYNLHSSTKNQIYHFQKNVSV